MISMVLEFPWDIVFTCGVGLLVLGAFFRYTRRSDDIEARERNGWRAHAIARDKAALLELEAEEKRRMQEVDEAPPEVTLAPAFQASALKEKVQEDRPKDAPPCPPRLLRINCAQWPYSAIEIETSSQCPGGMIEYVVALHNGETFRARFRSSTADACQTLYEDLTARFGNEIEAVFIPDYSWITCIRVKCRGSIVVDLSPAQLAALNAIAM